MRFLIQTYLQTSTILINHEISLISPSTVSCGNEDELPYIYCWPLWNPHHTLSDHIHLKDQQCITSVINACAKGIAWQMVTELKKETMVV